MTTARDMTKAAAVGSAGGETDLDETTLDLAREGFRLLLESIEKAGEKKPVSLDMDERAAKFRAALQAFEKERPSLKEKALTNREQFDSDNETAEIGPGQIAPSGNGSGTGEIENLPWRKGVESQDQGARPSLVPDGGHWAEAVTRPKALGRPVFAGGAIRPHAGGGARRSATEAARIHPHEHRGGGVGGGGFGDGIEKLRSDVNRNHAQLMSAITHKNFSRP